jgi:hypothetical protein
MPRIEQDYLDDTIDRRYFWAMITKIYSEDDTADITLVDENETPFDPEKTFTKCPIFFHCKPDAVKRSNGALTDAASAFQVNDIVYCFIVDSFVGKPTIIAGKELRSCGEDGFTFIFEGTFFVLSTTSLTHGGTFLDYKAYAFSPGSVAGNWTLTFTSSTTFSLIGPTSNLGSINSDFAPWNALAGGAYFTIPVACWIGTFATGDRITFSTLDFTSSVSLAYVKSRQFIWDPKKRTFEYKFYDYIPYYNAHDFHQLTYADNPSYYGLIPIQRYFSESYWTAPNKNRYTCSNFISGYDSHEPEITWISGALPLAGSGDGDIYSQVNILALKRSNRSTLFKEKICGSITTFPTNAHSGFLRIDRSNTSLPKFEFVSSYYGPSNLGTHYYLMKNVWTYNIATQTATRTTNESWDYPVAQISTWRDRCKSYWDVDYYDTYITPISPYTSDYRIVYPGCNSYFDVFNNEWMTNISTARVLTASYDTAAHWLGGGVSITVSAGCGDEFRSLSDFEVSTECNIGWTETVLFGQTLSTVDAGLSYACFCRCNDDGIEGIYHSQYVADQQNGIEQRWNGSIPLQCYFPLPMYVDKQVGTYASYSFAVPGQSFACGPLGCWGWWYQYFALCPDCILTEGGACIGVDWYSALNLPPAGNLEDYCTMYGCTPAQASGYAPITEDVPFPLHPTTFDFTVHPKEIDTLPEPGYDIYNVHWTGMPGGSDFTQDFFNGQPYISLAVGRQYALCSIALYDQVKVYEKVNQNSVWSTWSDITTEILNAIPLDDLPRFQGLVYSGRP